MDPNEMLGKEGAAVSVHVSSSEEKDWALEKQKEEELKSTKFVAEIVERPFVQPTFNSTTLLGQPAYSFCDITEQGKQCRTFAVLHDTVYTVVYLSSEKLFARYQKIYDLVLSSLQFTSQK